MDAKDAQTPEGEIGPWRTFSGIGGMVFWKAAGENIISIAFQMKGFGVCVPLAPLAPFALNGSEDVDALALGPRGAVRRIPGSLTSTRRIYLVWIWSAAA